MSDKPERDDDTNLDSPGLYFVSGKEAVTEPRPDRSDAEIEAEIRVRIQKNIGIHRTLARLDGSPQQHREPSEEEVVTDDGSQGLYFVSGAEARREPKPERSDAEIEANMRESVRKNIGILRTLSRL